MGLDLFRLPEVPRDFAAWRRLDWAQAGRELGSLLGAFARENGVRVGSLGVLTVLAALVAIRSTPAEFWLAAGLCALAYGYYFCFRAWSARQSPPEPAIVTPGEALPPYQYPHLRPLARPAFWGLNILLLAGLALLGANALTPCPGPAFYTFADSTPGPWLIRSEGSKRMGLDLKVSSEAACRGKPVSALKFSFQLAPEAGAQVGLDGQSHHVETGLTAWMYLPPATPATLRAVCFVMDTPARGYAWYQTAAQPARPGAWTKITCPVQAFHQVPGDGPAGWANPPQFIGFGFLDADGQAYPATVYLTSIDIQ